MCGGGLPHSVVFDRRQGQAGRCMCGGPRCLTQDKKRQAGGRTRGQAGGWVGGRIGRWAGRQAVADVPHTPIYKRQQLCGRLARRHAPHWPPLTLLQVFILNGATYDQRFLDATRTSSLSCADSTNPDRVAALNADLDDCALLTNNKGKPLLASLAGGKMTAEGRLLIQVVVSGRMRRGTTPLLEGSMWCCIVPPARLPALLCEVRTAQRSRPRACTNTQRLSASLAVCCTANMSTLPRPVLPCAALCCASPCSVGAWCCRT